MRSVAAMTLPAGRGVDAVDATNIRKHEPACADRASAARRCR
jgi:hypothetical protein